MPSNLLYMHEWSVQSKIHTSFCKCIFCGFIPHISIHTNFLLTQTLWWNKTQFLLSVITRAITQIKSRTATSSSNKLSPLLQQPLCLLGALIHPIYTFIHVLNHINFQYLFKMLRTSWSTLLCTSYNRKKTNTITPFQYNSCDKY